MQHRGSSDSRATADSHCEVQGSRNEIWKCHGNVSAEMCFSLGKRSRRGGPNASVGFLCTRHCHYIIIMRIDSI